MMGFIFGGGADNRNPVLPVLTIKDYTFRSRFLIPSEIDGSCFDIVTNNCVEFTFIETAL
jgi:hypothetical protein